MVDDATIIPSAVLEDIPKLVHAVQAHSVAILAAAIISKMQRPLTIGEAVDMARDIHFAMYPAFGSGTYNQWKKTGDERLRKVQE